LTHNHVVREFIELVADRVGADLDLHASADEVGTGSYDFLIVDDRGRLLEESMVLLEKLQPGQSIVLYTQEKALHEAFDFGIKKPFLPSEIQGILEKTSVAEQPQAGEQVLHRQDIEEIRALLESEGMEIVSEEDLLDEIAPEEPMRGEETEVVTQTIEGRLLEAVLEMEPKKMRKLLQGAELTITIRFPKEER